MLTDAQIAEYHDRGYVIPSYRLPPAEVEEIRERHALLLRRHPEFRDKASALLRYDLSFLNYARDPHILDMAEQLIGPDICMWNMSMFGKPALVGKRTPWHQDGIHWPISPMATCTVWIAIDASSRENGCVRFIPGSHKVQKLLPHHRNDAPDMLMNQELGADQFDESQAEDLVLAAGQMAFQDIFIVRGSGANRSSHPRRALTMRMMPTSSVYDRDLAREMHAERGGQDMSEHSIFLMRGVDRSGKNDFRMRAREWHN